MVMEFLLTPHTKSILCGRGMCEDDRLLCAATNCNFRPKDSPDPKFGREIEVKGFIICPRCKTMTKYSEGLEWNDELRRSIMKCKACNKIVSNNKIKWTQGVVSRHRKSRHEYFHKECWDSMFIDVEEDFASFCGFVDDYELIRLIKWAMKA